MDIRAQGRPVSMTYNGNTYYYALNLQGDVMALLDSSGNEVVSYHYNAWGKLLNTTASTTGMLNSLAKYNPLRYRGYVYDRETGLYYLQSRYYNPEICRFISADKISNLGEDGSVLSYNMFAYCLNNPIIYCDQEGESATIAGALCGAFFGAINAIMSGGSVEEIIECTVVGMVTGAAAGFAADFAVATLGGGAAVMLSASAGGIMSAANSAASQSILNDGEVDGGKVIYDGVIGAIAGGTSTAMGDLVKPIARGFQEGIKYTRSLISAEMTMLSAGKITTSILFDTGCSAVTGFGAWSFGLACDHYIRIG